MFSVSRHDVTGICRSGGCGEEKWVWTQPDDTMRIGEKVLLKQKGEFGCHSQELGVLEERRGQEI